jgi:hypothetical protein
VTSSESLSSRNTPTPLAYSSGDSLKVAGANLAIAAACKWGLPAINGQFLELLSAAPVFVSPTLALASAAFMIRDLRNRKDSDVVLAIVLSVVAVAVAWWSLLQAD